MGRVIFLRNIGVFVWEERGSPHHLPHAHVCRRGQRLASVFLLSLEIFNEVERLSLEVLDAIHARQDDLLAEWTRLNGD
jgi:hypothetical protein